ncbi:MAG: DNA methyltransferase [Nitrospirales bacterium]|nr:MAG: DNA methyltransferase [Nitrospirales bacterium]
MFEQAFRNIDDVLRKEAGCTTELDYTEQTSWLLFLKYLDGLEQDKATEAKLVGKKYQKAQTGDDLRDFVILKLFPYLHGFKQKASGPNTIEYKIGEIFGEIKNKIQSGYNLREIIDHIDELRFRSQAEKHELSHLYEAKIRNMGNAGRNGGEYYTPRPLIRAMVQVVKPKIGQRIYDGACGSAGFLCESFDYLKSKKRNLTTKDLTTLQSRTFYGKEKKSLAYVIAIMNMILHGIEAPNIIHTNTLTENLADIQEKDRYEIVLANPPFGGKERKEVQQNFPIRTGETAFLFLQHFIKMLKAGGRGGMVIKNTFLSNTDNASVSLRKLLLESCNLHTVLDCPGGTFQGAGVKTVVLFFEKGAPTRKIWFYQLDPGRSLGKTNPLNDRDLSEFVKLQKTFSDSPKSWTVDIKSIDPPSYDLSVKNPNGSEVIAHRSPQEIMDEIAALDAESGKVLGNIRVLL